MCGIVGVYEYGRTSGGVSEDVVIRMRETVRHRGPDDAGLFISEDRRLGLGSRRLSIIDPEGGAQPMFGRDGTCLVFNGEIYNYPDLRRALESDGIHLKTNCDTEVILHLYTRHRERCVDYLDGMFAFALWDAKEASLFFARDRIGEKPLYWADRGGVFVFASEIKALLEHPTVVPEVNPTVLGPYLANLVTPGPETLYRGVQKLGSGCLGICDARGVRTSRYWSVATRSHDASVSDEDAISEVRALLEDAVATRLISDVPIGVLLSGGVDSSTIVALLGEHGRRVDTFTVGFPGHDGFDERREARWVARHFGMTHHEVELAESDALDLLPALIHHQDEPMADPVCLPLLAVCQLAHSVGVKVVLAGEGADELFWGYSGYASTLKKWRRFAAALAMPTLVRRLAPHAVSPTRHPHRREQLEWIARGRLHPIHLPLGLTRHQRERLAHMADGTGWAPGPRGRNEARLDTLAFDTQEYEFGVRLPELLLMRIDRFSMATSVEARVPFLAPALVEYVYRLPLGLKVRDQATKFVLKQAIADIVPGRVLERPKLGFNAPTSAWFAGRHGELLRSLMREDALRRYFDIGYLETLAYSVDPTSWQFGVVLWPILNFALWHKYWIEREPLEPILSAAARSGAA